jgi:hypothetical protein
MRCIQTQEDSRRKTNGGTLCGAERAAAGATVTGEIIAVSARCPACRALRRQNLKKLAVGVIQRNLPVTAATTSAQNHGTP